MKLLFDESLSPMLVLLLRDLFPESESAFEMGLPVSATAGSWTTPPLATSSWSRQTAIFKAC